MLCRELFLGETLSYVILDSRCTKSVCSKVWLQCYLDTLNESDKSSVQEQESSSKFKFGDGVVQTSLRGGGSLKFGVLRHVFEDSSIT